MGDLIDNDYSDGEYSQIWDHTTPKAKQDYRCFECGGTIQKGEKYSKTSSLYDGSWTHYKECQQCCTVRRLSSSRFTTQPQFGLLLEHLLENRREDPEYLEMYIDNAKKRGSRIPQWALDEIVKH